MSFLRLAVIATVVTVGCGTRTSLPLEDDDGIGEGGNDGNGGAPSTCEYERSPIETQPGVCASDGLECGAECGSCAALDASCFEDRCYRPEGPVPTFVPSLLRELRGGAEGNACTVRTSGMLERVEAALWYNATKDVRLDVWLPCRDGFAIAASRTLSWSELPRYAELSSEMRSTTFAIEPPLRVTAGEQIRVLFTAIDSDPDQPGEGLVSGISTFDVDPQCQFFMEEGEVPEAWQAWDYMARLYIH